MIAIPTIRMPAESGVHEIIFPEKLMVWENSTKLRPELFLRVESHPPDGK
jgi:hypothetical protein